MSESYAKEDIPDDDLLFYRIHKQYIIDGDIIPSAFQGKVDGMSTDWNKYATAQNSLELSKIPSDNAIVSLPVNKIRSESSMTVEHNPQSYNRAHSLVLGIPDKGDLKTRARSILKRICKVEIKYIKN